MINGLEGLEKYYDEVLRGEPGRILRMADATRDRTPEQQEKIMCHQCTGKTLC